MSRGPRHDQVRLFVEIGRRLDAKGFIAANDGNLSVREPDGTFLVTATGARKGYLRPEEVVRVDVAGRLVDGVRPPSSETAMHLAIYRERPDIAAIVHAHPPVATGFAVAREPMDACVLPEIVLTLGSIPIAPYGTPGTGELGSGLAPVVRGHDVVLLANHGAVALGPDLEEAYFRMERLEHTARILLSARLLGRVETLDREAVTRLLATAGPVATGPLPCVPALRPSVLGVSPPPGQALADPARSGYGDPPGTGTGSGAAPHEAARGSASSADPDDRAKLARIVIEVLKERGLLP